MYKKKWKRNMAVFMTGVMVSSQIMVPVSAKEPTTSQSTQEEKTTDQSSNEKSDSKSNHTKSDSDEKKETSKKENTDKEEVVYANLDADGKKKGVYVVNIFNDAEDIVDYGDYTNIRNMNTTDEIVDKDGIITATTDQSSLYYEGTLEECELPWKGLFCAGNGWEIGETKYETKDSAK